MLHLIILLLLGCQPLLAMELGWGWEIISVPNPRNNIFQLNNKDNSGKSITNQKLKKQKSLKFILRKSTLSNSQGTKYSYSRRLADLFATNRQAFVNVMMLEELGLVVDDSNYVLNGFVNFFSFVILGFKQEELNFSCQAS